MKSNVSHCCGGSHDTRIPYCCGGNTNQKFVCTCSHCCGGKIRRYPSQILHLNVKQFFVPLLILRVCLFLGNRGWGTRQKKLQRSSEYHERVAELEIVHNQALANSQTPSTPPPQLHFVMSPSPPPPPPPHAPRAARRLNITMGSPQTADPAARPRSPSLDRWPGVGHTPSKTSRL